MPTPQEQLAIAIDYHRRGDLANAEKLYRAILRTNPNDPDALHLLGVIANQCQKFSVAIEYIGKAIAIAPNNAPFHSNLGLAYLESSQTAAARESFGRAISVDPNFATGYNGLGVVARTTRDFDTAKSRFEQALAIQPQFMEAHMNLGVTLEDMGHSQGAIEAYHRALEIQPDHADVYYNLGNAYRSQWRFDEAVEAYRSAVRLRPKYPDAQNNLGNVLLEQGKIEEAIEVLTIAVGLNPLSSDTHYNLGNALVRRGDSDRALESLQQSLALNPTRVETACTLLTEYQHRCQWQDLERLTRLIIQAAERLSSSENGPLIAPFSYIALPTPISPALQYQAARRWSASNYRIPASMVGLIHHARKRTHHDRLRIAYLSADYRNHAVAFMIPELLEQHDRTQFEIYGYSMGPDDRSSIRNRIHRAFDHFHDVKDLSFYDTARKIADDQIDILIDLQGHTLHARTKLLALRPAPIQVSYIGFPGTMGVDFIDYILVDHFVAPPDQQPHFSERLVHLPGCYQVNDSQHEIAPTTPTRGECGLPNDAFVFCSFNNHFKLTPQMFDVWMRLLRAIPNSVLWLPEWKAGVKANLCKEAALRGVDPERMIFAKVIPIAEHLARHRLADLFLDSYPYSAHATASIALRMGVPMVTLEGATMASRVAGSLLHTLGLPELIASSFEEYESIAIDLASRSEALCNVKQKLESQLKSTDLFSGAAFARKVEQAYQDMWCLYCHKEHKEEGSS